MSDISGYLQRPLTTITHQEVAWRRDPDIPVLIVNPNPVFDRTVTVPALVPGAVVRAIDVDISAGGKGINVARVLRALGESAPLLVPVASTDADEYRCLLDREGAHADIMTVPGHVRVATILREMDGSRVTVVNEPGDAMSDADWTELCRAVVARIGVGDRVLCMGSMPRGLPKTSIGTLISLVHEQGASILIDTSPDHLGASLSFEPDVVCPNVHEAKAALTSAAAMVMDEADSVNPRVHAEEAARQLCARGARHAVVTAGEAGVAFSDGLRTIWIDAPRVDVVSPVGAGDAFVGGLTHLWMHGELDWERILRSGVAAASASCEQVLAGGIVRERYEALVDALSFPVRAS